jgi:hypothetical protein
MRGEVCYEWTLDVLSWREGIMLDPFGQGRTFADGKTPGPQTAFLSETSPSVCLSPKHFEIVTSISQEEEELASPEIKNWHVSRIRRWSWLITFGFCEFGGLSKRCTVNTMYCKIYVLQKPSSS